MNRQYEKVGVALILSSGILWSLYPILVNRGGQTIPPFSFAALSTLIASLGAFFYSVQQKKLKEWQNRTAYFPLFMVTLCIIIIPSLFFFSGARMTSGLNASLLLLSEIIFTIIFTHFIGEKTTLIKLIGSLSILFGAILISYTGYGGFGKGDLLIILSTITYPLGNFYSKKALNVVSTSTILFTRLFLGGLFLLAVAFFFEHPNFLELLSTHWKLICLNGLLVLCFSKVLWYEGFKRLDISKAVSLIMCSPLFSITILLFLGEKISKQQTIGIFAMLFGLYFTIIRKSVKPSLTKYGT